MGSEMCIRDSGSHRVAGHDDDREVHRPRNRPHGREGGLPAHGRGPRVHREDAPGKAARDERAIPRRPPSFASSSVAPTKAIVRGRKKAESRVIGRKRNPTRHGDGGCELAAPPLDLGMHGEGRILLLNVDQGWKRHIAKMMGRARCSHLTRRNRRVRIVSPKGQNPLIRKEEA